METVSQTDTLSTARPLYRFFSCNSIAPHLIFDVWAFQKRPHSEQEPDDVIPRMTGRHFSDLRKGVMG